MKNGHKKEDCRKFLKWKAKKEKSEDHSTKAVQEMNIIFRCKQVTVVQIRSMSLLEQRTTCQLTKLASKK